MLTFLTASSLVVEQLVGVFSRLIKIITKYGGEQSPPTGSEENAVAA
jgi:hypothetical protein